MSTARIWSRQIEQPKHTGRAYESSRSIVTRSNASAFILKQELNR